MLYAIGTVLVVILDQFVKYWVGGHITTEAISVIPGVLSLVNVHNTGAAFSFLSGGEARIPFIIICGVFTVAVIIALATNFISGKLGRWSAVMVVAGGLGNCIDRILYGYVQDMFKLDIFPNFAIFNVADIFITVFCFVFILYVIFGSFGKKSSDEDDEDEDEEEYEEEDDEPEEKPRKQRRWGRAAREEEEDTDEDEDEPEEERPRKQRRWGRAAREEEEETDEDEGEYEYEEPALPRRQSSETGRSGVSGRKAKQAKYNADFEQYKANHAARREQQEDIAAKMAAPIDPADPFAEWERANAKIEDEQRQTAAARAEMSAKPAAKPVEKAESAVKAPAAPVVEEKAAKAPAASAEEFSLDDILGEFK